MAQPTRNPRPLSLCPWRPVSSSSKGLSFGLSRKGRVSTLKTRPPNSGKRYRFPLVLRARERGAAPLRDQRERERCVLQMRWRTRVRSARSWGACSGNRRGGTGVAPGSSGVSAAFTEAEMGFGWSRCACDGQGVALALGTVVWGRGWGLNAGGEVSFQAWLPETTILVTRGSAFMAPGRGGGGSGGRDCAGGGHRVCAHLCCGASALPATGSRPTPVCPGLLGPAESGAGRERRGLSRVFPPPSPPCSRRGLPLCPKPGPSRGEIWRRTQLPPQLVPTSSPLSSLAAWKRMSRGSLETAGLLVPPEGRPGTDPRDVPSPCTLQPPSVPRPRFCSLRLLGLGPPPTAPVPLAAPAPSCRVHGLGLGLGLGIQLGLRVGSGGWLRVGDMVRSQGWFRGLV